MKDTFSSGRRVGAPASGALGAPARGGRDRLGPSEPGQRLCPGQKRGSATNPNPTVRGKAGAKRHRKSGVQAGSTAARTRLGTMLDYSDREHRSAPGCDPRDRAGRRLTESARAVPCDPSRADWMRCVRSSLGRCSAAPARSAPRGSAVPARCGPSHEGAREIDPRKGVGNYPSDARRC